MRLEPLVDNRSVPACATPIAPRSVQVLRSSQYKQNGDNMLLIWGSKVRYKADSSGTFYCPNEGGDRPYSVMHATKWFTFFFIPILKTADLGEFVQCETCKNQYDPRVLTNPTSGELLDNLANGMRQAVVAIVRADGEVDAQEKNMALQVMGKYSDSPYTMEQLDNDIASLPATGLVEQMDKCAGVLNPQGKENMIRSCILVAMADGDFAAEEEKEIHVAGEALGMSRAHISGAISEMRTEMASMLADGKLTSNEVEGRDELSSLDANQDTIDPL